MVRHEIQDKTETHRVRGSDQRVEIVHRAKQRIDSGIVADVIAKVPHRRRKYRRDPKRIDAKLGHPEFDPHGHAIPALDGSLPSHEPRTLSQLKPGQTAKVESVSDKDPEMLRYLATQGIRPGVRLTLGEQLPFKGAYQVRIGSSARLALLSLSLAEAISVAVK